MRTLLRSTLAALRWRTSNHRHRPFLSVPFLWGLFGSHAGLELLSQWMWVLVQLLRPRESLLPLRYQVLIAILGPCLCKRVGSRNSLQTQKTYKMYPAATYPTLTDVLWLVTMVEMSANRGRLVRSNSIIYSPSRPLSFSLSWIPLLGRPQVLLESHPLLCSLELSVVGLRNGQVECVESVNNQKLLTRYTWHRWCCIQRQ
jgi:hypothetical protein